MSGGPRGDELAVSPAVRIHADCLNAKISCMMIDLLSMPTTSEMLVTFRGPPWSRLAWMTRSTAEANCDRRARIGSSRPAMLIMVSSR